VDAEVTKTSVVLADGEGVWFRRPKLALSFATMSRSDGGNRARLTEESAL
jgi:hypothetical protein